MHAEQLDVDLSLARTLIDEQFPVYADRRLERLETSGTDNTIVRVGGDLTARFPLQATSAEALESEASALAELADRVRTPSPAPAGIGTASEGYPSAWSLQTWVPGTTADPVSYADSTTLAEDLGALIMELRAPDIAGRSFDGRGRGGSLTDHDDWVAHCFSKSTHLLDTPRAARLWDELRDLPTSGPAVMSHRDLIPMNLLVPEVAGPARLSGLLDGSAFGPADPGLDLVVAWHLFDEPAREVLRRSLDAGECEWLRGAAWALEQAMGLVWYYEDSNPAMSSLGLTTMRRILSDPGLCDRAE